MSDWTECAECGHLGVEHATTGVCVFGWRIPSTDGACPCEEFVAEVAK